ncbi:hypothetical protein LCGC14_2335160 [marine sediment metagenome]|uniref:Uncharacterized protein n=1 Tax=marine sediment metagenome TaxID=412755 RepID=A0A0F9ERG1_9ZZZZ
MIINNEIFCINCVMEEEVGKETSDEIITTDGIEADSNKSYFCDRCKHLL